MIVRVPNVGQYGVNRDLSQHELPINAWTDANNIRFIDGSARRVLGYRELYPTSSISIYHIAPLNVAGVRTWIYAGANKIYTVANGAIHTNITRQTVGVDVDYTAVRNGWTSCLLGGIPILNNGADAPQQWLLSGRATELSNWPTNTLAKVIRTYKNSLIALNISKAGSSYPYMVKWSHPADAGTVPVSWDETDPTKDAGEMDLSEGFDEIVDGLALRDSFMIYKQSSVWRMDYTGGVFVYKFQKVLGTSGALSRNCIVELNGLHFVLSSTDCIVHDGQTATSVLDKQTRRDLFAQIDSTYADRCFVFVNKLYNEVFVCFPKLGSTVCNKALVWNYVDKTTSFRDIPNLNHGASGAVDDSSNSTWAGDTTSWESDTTPWDSEGSSLNRVATVMAGNGGKLFLLDSTAYFDYTVVFSYLERVGLSVGEPESIKLFRSVKPRISGAIGETVMVSVGTSADPYGAVTYNAPVAFTIGSSVSVDSFCTGRYMAIKFSNGSAANWSLDSYDIDVQKAGSW